jgi:hypothetical protein
MAQISLDDIDIGNLLNRIRAASTAQVQVATVPSGSEVTLTTTATPYNVTSLALGAGTWLVWGTVDFDMTGCTSTVQQLGINTTSATLPTQAGGGGIGADALVINRVPTTTLTGVINDAVMPVVVTLAAPGTVYLVAELTFSAGSAKAYGTLSAMPL